MYSIREICLDFKALKREWLGLYCVLPRNLDKTALNAEKLDAAYVKYGSFLKSWNKNDFFQG